jgi:exportin-T
MLTASQAMDFLDQVKGSPEGWSACLTIFTSQPKPSDVMRSYALEVLNNAIRYRTAELGPQSLEYIKNSLMEYIRQNYKIAFQPDSHAVQGKLVQTITYLFTKLYTTSWTSFFDELASLTTLVKEVDNGRPDNEDGTRMYLRVMVDIHDEIAETTFDRSMEDQKRNTIIKDFVRDHDMQKLVASWQEILTQWRGVNIELVERVLTVFAKWVSWIDISLVVNDTFLGQLSELLQGVGGEDALRSRQAATVTLEEIAGKGMKPVEKLELIAFLQLTDVVRGLISLDDMHGNEEENLDFAEAVGGLTNKIVLDLVKMLEAVRTFYSSRFTCYYAHKDINRILAWITRAERQRKIC